MFKKITLSMLALIATVGLALAISGNQIGFPVVGGASYCAGFGNNNVCNTTIPAGPTVVTGNETILANTNLPGGQAPQTVLLSMASINALPYQYATPLTGTSVTVAATTGALVLDPAGTIAALTVVFPASTVLVDGQTLEIASSQTVTALTITPGSGTTVAQSPTAITTSTTAPYGYKFIYVASVTKWIREQ